MVAERSNAYRLSFDAGRAVPINSASTFADGIAVRVPDEQGVAMINSGACAIVEVSDDEIASAIRTFHEDTHNLAEGAGAAARQVSRPIANALEGAKSQSFLVGVILTGHGLRACSEAVRPLSASRALRCPFAWPLTPSVMAAQEKAPDCFGAF